MVTEHNNLMCQSHQQLCIAQRSAHRLITKCSHDSVHVHWDNLTLSWQLNDFLRFGALIFKQLSKGPLPEPSVMLRVNQMSVTWLTDDFSVFAGMILEAKKNLEQALEEIANQPAADQTFPSNSNFSLN
ncbi:MAG: hypothetical protein AAF633_25730 [Chloroflexota bacterium]